ncbi:hypothetical protein Tco_1216775 [Tanacetum coccineum]
MASSRSSSSLESEVDSCSKTCVIAYASLKEQYDNLSFNYKKSQFKLVSYKAGLESIEARQVHYNKNESMLEDSINVLKLEVIDKFKKGLGYDAATAASPVVEGFVNLTNKYGSDKASAERVLSPINKELVSDGKKKIVVPTIPKVDVVRPKQQEKPVRKADKLIMLDKRQWLMLLEQIGLMMLKHQHVRFGDLSNLIGNPETKLEDLVRLNSPKDEKRPGAELTQQNDKS